MLRGGWGDDGDVVVHTRVGRTRFGAVESTFDVDFRRLMDDDFIFVGRGEGTLMFMRSIMNTRDKVSRGKRQVHKLRADCVRHTERL